MHTLMNCYQKLRTGAHLDNLDISYLHGDEAKSFQLGALVIQLLHRGAGRKAERQGHDRQQARHHHLRIRPVRPQDADKTLATAWLKPAGPQWAWRPACSGWAWVATQHG